jgi:mannitol 2-dehydrogenase
MPTFGNGSSGDRIPLNTEALKKLPRDVSSPEYDRTRLKQSIVHIGVGGFFRSHQAVYLDDFINLTGSMEWGYCEHFATTRLFV